MSHLKNPFTHTDFFFFHSVMMLKLIHIPANVVTYQCFQFQHVALAISLTWCITTYTCVGKKQNPVK